MNTRDNAFNTTMTLSIERNSAEQPGTTGQLPARPAVRSLSVLETLINGFPKVELRTAELNSQLRKDRLWLRVLPVVNRCLHT